MIKKIVLVLIVSCLAFGMAFAAKGDIKVGGQAGFGTDRTRRQIILGTDTKEVIKAYNNGFFFTASGEYDVTDEIGVKLEAGILTMGTGKIRTIVKDLDQDNTVDGDEAPVNFSLYLGGQYEFNIGEDFALAAGAGVDMMLGKQYNEADKANGRIGVGAEVVGSYAVNKDLSVTLGARYAIYFINTDSDVASNLKDEKDAGTKILQSGLKIFAGCTYTL